MAAINKIDKKASAIKNAILFGKAETHCMSEEKINIFLRPLACFKRLNLNEQSFPTFYQFTKCLDVNPESPPHLLIFS